MSRFDTVVVGAGSAGCVLAARLSEEPAHRVLLLEAGPDHSDADLPDALRFLSRPIDAPYEWGDRVHSIRERTLPYLRGRGTGGSSATNGGVAMRAEPPDFEGWPEGWGWDDLLPCFRRLERDLDFGSAPWHGDAGPIPVVRWPRDTWTPIQSAFVEACAKHGFGECADHNEPGTTGVGAIPMNRVESRRMSCATTYLEPARGRPNLTVRGDAHVRRVLIDGSRAVGVELADGETVDTERVVIAAGVIQSPLLLWRSGVGPANHVRALGIEPLVDLPGVGAHLSDHMVLTLACPMDPAFHPRGSPGLQTLLRATAPGSERGHDLHLTPYVQRGSDKQLELAISISLQLPVGFGRVAPTSPDPGVPAHIEWPFAGEPENVRRVREGYRIAARLAEATGACPDPSGLETILAAGDATLDETVAAEHTAFYHGVGTCRMADADDPDGVVDTDCQVRGTTGLRVVDASIAPRVPSSNTNTLVIAMAERAVERWTSNAA